VEDYPRTVEEFEARFSSEEACRAYLVKPAVAGWISMLIMSGQEGGFSS
jgi:hypothetical protein